MRKQISFLLSYCALCLIFFSSASLAGAEEQNTWHYIHKMRDMLTQAEGSVLYFTHSNESGEKYQGAVVLGANHRFRIIYYAPYPLTFVGYPAKIAVYDYEMEHLTFISQEDNPIDFLVAAEAQLPKYFEIIDTAQDNKTLRIMLRQIKHEKLIEITLDRQTARPLQLVFHNDEGDSVMFFTHIAPAIQLDKTIFKIKPSEHQPIVFIRTEAELKNYLKF